MEYPKVELVDFNASKPNPQSWNKFDATAWQGRVIYTAKILDLNGWTMNTKWFWQFDSEHYIQGTSPDHIETWGDNNEHYKRGGKFKNLEDCYLIFGCSAEFEKDGAAQILSWSKKFMTNTNGEDLSEITVPGQGDTSEPPEPITTSWSKIVITPDIITIEK